MTLAWQPLVDADMTQDGWQFSEPTDATILRIDQENSPDIGRFAIAQVSLDQSEFLSNQAYPARTESLRITLDYVGEGQRLIAIRQRYAEFPENVPNTWRIKIYGAKADFQPPINPSAIVLTLDPRVAGAIPLEEKGIALGVATLNENGVVPDDQLPNFGVTLAQIGTELTGAEIRSKAYTDQKIEAIFSDPLLLPAPTLEELGGEPAGTAAAAIAAHEAETDPHNQYVMDAELAIHTTNLSNPHNVTLAQIGAEPSGAEVRSSAYTDQKIGALDYPTNHLHIWGYGKPPSGKTFSTFDQSGCELGRYVILNNAVQGDTVEYEVFLKAGSYVMTTYGRSTNNRAIAAFYINNNFIGTADYYASVANNKKIDTFNFNVPTSGLHSIKVIAAGKNPSSGGWNLGLSVIRIDPQLITAPNPFIPIRINCGCPVSYTDPQGNLWLPNLWDDNPGSQYDLEAVMGSFTVEGTDKQKLYKFEVSKDNGVFSYTLPIYQPGSGYELKLHFSENFHNSAGLRVGSVSLNGNALLNNFDIFAQAGGKNKALVKTFPNLVLSTCKIEVLNTLINAIELTRNI